MKKMTMQRCYQENVSCQGLTHFFYCLFLEKADKALYEAKKTEGIE